MASLSDLQGTVQTLSGAIVQMGSTIGGLIVHLQKVQQDVINLQNQVAILQVGGGVSGTDLDGVVDNLNALAKECTDITAFLQPSLTSKP